MLIIQHRLDFVRFEPSYGVIAPRFFDEVEISVILFLGALSDAWALITAVVEFQLISGAFPEFDNQGREGPPDPGSNGLADGLGFIYGIPKLFDIFWIGQGVLAVGDIEERLLPNVAALNGLDPRQLYQPGGELDRQRLAQ
jgi:hypothetical protein